MLNTKQFKKTLLASSLVALFSLGTAASFAQEAGAEPSYVDSATGEVKQATKLLSEMTDQEKSLLSNEEYTALQELEANANNEAQIEDVPAE